MKVGELNIGDKFGDGVVHWKGTADQLPTEVKEDWKESPVLPALIKDKVDMVVFKWNKAHENVTGGCDGISHHKSWYSWIPADRLVSDYIGEE